MDAADRIFLRLTTLRSGSSTDIRCRHYTHVRPRDCRRHPHDPPGDVLGVRPQHHGAALIKMEPQE